MCNKRAINDIILSESLDIQSFHVLRPFMDAGLTHALPVMYVCSVDTRPKYTYVVLSGICPVSFTLHTPCGVQDWYKPISSPDQLLS